MLLAASGLRIRVPGATIGATLAYSVYLTHKQVIHLDRIYLKGFVPLDGPLGFLVYGVTILIVGAILYVFVERPFLQMRERIRPQRGVAPSQKSGLAKTSFCDACRSFNNAPFGLGRRIL